MQRIASTRQAGFTMIELVMVIVIIGILAAFAIPRFADLGTTARQNAMKGSVGAVNSAASIVKAQALASNDSDGSITVDGQAITFNTTSRYPTADAAGIGVAASLTAADFAFAAKGAGNDAVITFQSNANCTFTYDEDTGLATITNNACN